MTQPVDPEVSPQDAQPVPRAVVWVSGALLAGIAAFMVMSQTSLYGDGAYYLLQIIRERSPLVVPGREAANFLQAAPVLAALSLDIDNTRVLATMHGVGLLFLPAVIWWIALKVSSKNSIYFYIVSILCAVVLGLMATFAVSEIVFGLPLVVLVMSLLVDRREFSTGRAVLLIAAALPLTATHESLALCAIPIGLLAWLRGRQSAPQSIGRWAALTTSALSLLTLAWAAWTFVTNRNGNSASFFASVVDLSPRVAVLWVFASITLTAWLLLPDLRRRRVLSGLVLLVMLMAFMTGVAAMTAQAGGLSYASRSWCVLLTLGGQCVLFYLWKQTSSSPNCHRTPIRFMRQVQFVERGWLVTPILLAVVMGVPLLTQTVSWSEGLVEVRSALTNNPEALIGENELPPEAQLILWGWPNPSLSVIVRPDPGSGIVRGPDDGNYEPFPPEQAHAQLPSRFTWR